MPSFAVIQENLPDGGNTSTYTVPSDATGGVVTYWAVTVISGSPVAAFLELNGIIVAGGYTTGDEGTQLGGIVRVGLKAGDELLISTNTGVSVGCHATANISGI